MIMTLRRKNLMIARALHEGLLGNLAKAFGPSMSEATLSRLSNGNTEITDTLARQIEQKLGLAEYWLDRDNESLLRMSYIDHQVHLQTARLPDDKKQHLIPLLSPARSE
jgi:plasmid maintenance system antidote protein VapI